LEKGFRDRGALTARPLQRRGGASSEVARGSLRITQNCLCKIATVARIRVDISALEKIKNRLNQGGFLFSNCKAV
jgi:hypothetical protein